MSSQVTTPKPNPNIFVENLEKIGLTPKMLITAASKSALSALTMNYIPPKKMPLIGKFLSANPIPSIATYGMIGELEFALINKYILNRD